MRIILASASPRRKELLNEIVSDFEVIPSRSEERADQKLAPEKIVEELAKQKAESVFAEHRDALVIGADTIVYFQGKVLGKPKDAQDAKKTLRALSGRTHSVYTGWCICEGDREETGFCRSDVTFRELSEDFIEEYVKSGSPLDKAGSYGIQDDARLVEKYEGSYTNIIGLPLEEMKAQLRGFGVIS